MNITESEELQLPILFHNGVFPDYKYSQCDTSDTYNFVNDYVTRRQILEQKDPIVALKEKNGFNRLAIMYPKREVTLHGRWYKETETGLFFSTSSYLPFSHKRHEEPWVNNEKEVIVPYVYNRAEFVSRYATGTKDNNEAMNRARSMEEYYEDFYN